MLNIIDLFSGAGGLTEGFRSPDFNIIAHVEMDSAASQTLELRDIYYYLKKSGNINLYLDFMHNNLSFTELKKSVQSELTSSVINEAIGAITLPEIMSQIDQKLAGRKVHGVIGGPPCQAYSTVGRKRNESKKATDERIYLYKYYINFLEKYQPDFFLFENVRGLLSFKDINNELLFNKILNDFQSMTPSYIVKWKLLNASDYGVPQSRRRLFLFGYREGLKSIELFEHLQTQQAPSIRELFRDLPTIAAGETANYYNTQSPSEYVKQYLRSENVPLTWNVSRPNNPRDLEIYKIAAKLRQKGKILSYPDLPVSLRTQHPEGFTDRFKAIPFDGISQTVVAHIAKDGHYYIHPDARQNRSITVREAARIQTFPDDFVFMRSRTDAFKQIGNAVPPHLAKQFGQIIAQQKKKFID
ncbi:DNA cytosine methyltransferase [Lacticaseibacillus hulanensis]|uniref:DNA cytosine methyltransferase n=1 Tax=Lacticaseibacillus hulanensis TaxID=2493111 RepID=UPI000FD9777C|nr:DNA cytosine methyltransferase [Lacticaseibacillus hulanensis]